MVLLMQRRAPLAVDEVYHVYNRGAHKARIFRRDADKDRFQLLLYLANDSSPLSFRELSLKYKGRSFADAFVRETPDKSLVDVLAYSLMPNHFHLMLRQKTEEGITTFIKKLATAYSMYFNGQHKHSGVLFQGRFKSSHIDGNAYFRYLLSYIHLNPIELVEPQWKEEKIQDPRRARTFLNRYRHSSFYDYSVRERPERVILAHDEIRDVLGKQNDFEELLEARKEILRDGSVEAFE